MFLYTSTFGQEELRLENQRPITLVSNHTWNQYDAIQPIELNGDSISELFLTRNSEIELCIRRSDSLVCTEVSNAGKIGWPPHTRRQDLRQQYFYIFIGR